MNVTNGMDNIINWLIENKEWIFQGIGALLIIEVVRRIIKSDRSIDKSQTISQTQTNKQIQTGGDNSINIQAKRDVNIFNGRKKFLVTNEIVNRRVSFDNKISEIKPVDIFDKISKSTPYQRENIRKSYEDIEVTWLMELNTISKYDYSYKASFTDSELIGKLVFCDINLEEHPEFKVLDAGYKVFVSGKIKTVTTLNIFLTNCRFELFSDFEKSRNV